MCDRRSTLSGEPKFEPDNGFPMLGCVGPNEEIFGGFARLNFRGDDNEQRRKMLQKPIALYRNKKVSSDGTIIRL